MVHAWLYLYSKQVVSQNPLISFKIITSNIMYLIMQVLKCMRKLLLKNVVHNMPSKLLVIFSKTTIFKKKMRIILKIIHHILISKYTLECTQLNHILKIFLEDHTPNILAMELHNDTHLTTTQVGYVLEYLPINGIISKIMPPCLNIDFYP